MSELLGVDVSTYQGNMNWKKASEAGVQFAFIRATFGFSVDAQFKTNWKNAKEAGIPRGAYGWCIYGLNQVSAATFFWEQIKDDPGELPPVVDFEKYGTNFVGFSALQLYVETLEKLCGKKPIIYTSLGYWTSLKDYGKQYWALNYPFWLAQYTTATIPRLPAPFTDWTFWQYSADGNGQGNKYGAQSSAIDLDRFNGDIIDLYRFMGVGTVPEEPEIPDPDHEIRIANLEGKLLILTEWARSIGYRG